MIEVLRITSDAEKPVVDVLVPGWRALEAVRIPGALLPPELHDSVGEGDLLVGRVNIGAETSEELFFQDIRRARDPLPDQVIWPT
jgi:hypothetical protein